MIKNSCKKIWDNIDAETIVMAVVASLSLLFFYNPLNGVALLSWDRTFCTASLAGIDISKRVSNFNILVFVLFPAATFIFAFLFSHLFPKGMPGKARFFKADLVLGILVLICYGLRYYAIPVSAGAKILAAIVLFAQLALAVLFKRNRYSETNVAVKRKNSVNERLLSAFGNDKLKEHFIIFSSVLTGLCGFFPLPGFSLNGHVLARYAAFAVAFAILYGSLAFFRTRIFRIPQTGINQLCGISAFAFWASLAAYFSKIAIPFLASKSDIYALMLHTVLPDSLTPILTIGLLSAYFLSREKRDDTHPPDLYFTFAFLLVSSISFALFLPVNATIGACAAGSVLLLHPTVRWIRKRIGLQEQGRNSTPMHNDSYALKNATRIFMWMPFFLCLFLELIFTINEKGLIKCNFGIAAYTFLFVFVAFTFIVSGFSKTSQWITRHGDVFGYLGGLLSICTLGYLNISYSYIWNYQNYHYVYEMGNKMGAADSLFGGLAPIIDYFSAHALFDMWTGYIHGLIHDSVIGLLINPYEGLNIVCSAVILFFLLKKLFNPFFAFFFLALFPLETLGLKTYSICLIAALLHLWLYKRNTLFKFFIFWILIAVNAFFIYDDGMALGIGSIVCTLVMFASNRDWRQTKSFVLTGIITGLVISQFCVFYCLYNNIDFAERFKEWLALSVQSNSSWATKEFGNPQKLSFLYSYILLPLTASFILFFTSIYSIKNKRISVFASLSVLFALAELLYLPRGIVYHNLWACNGTTGRLLNYSHFTISFFILFLISIRNNHPKYGRYFWMTAIACCIWGSSLLVTFYLPNTSSILFNHAANKIESLKTNYTANPTQSRYSYDTATAKFIGQFQTVFDRLLQKNETFLDFANMTALYALTGRERPFYVEQSPSLLTNLYSQEKYIEEISRHSVPLAITGLTADLYTQSISWVPHNIRYYHIAEYIYRNYRPLVKIGNFVIWSKKNRYEEFAHKLKETANNGSFIFTNYGYLPHQEYHHFNLEMNPYIWANRDKLNAISNKMIDQGEKSASGFTFDGSQSYDTRKGNYIAFEISSATEQSAAVSLKDKDDEESEYDYAFAVFSGTNKYLIRASQNYNWFAYDINSVGIKCNGCTVNNVRILQGD